MVNNDYSNLLIIADDFTGANDTGVQLTKKGAYVDVYFDWQSNYIKSLSDVIVLNTDSRALTKEEAKTRIKQLISSNNSKRAIYKKIDSTLRGNIGYEIETLLTLTNYQFALIVPAFPDMNRTVLNGISYVNGIELINTEFATDPKTPIYSSSIKQCLAQQTDLLSLEIGLDIVKANKLVHKLTLEAKNGIKLFITDAQTNEDLQSIVQQITNLNFKALLVGSAGLINYLPTNYPIKSSTKKANSVDKKMLVIAGSMSQVTQKQIQHATMSTDLWQVIDLDIDDILPKFSNNQLKHYCQLITDIFIQHKNVIITTCKDDRQRHQVELYCQKYRLNRKELGEYICQCLGKIVKNIAVNNLFLTGGDVAIAVAKSLGATGFHIEGEVTAGVPYGTLIGKTQQNYRIFTKAGGFGQANIFTKSLELI